MRRDRRIGERQYKRRQQRDADHDEASLDGRDVTCERWENAGHDVTTRDQCEGEDSFPSP